MLPPDRTVVGSSVAIRSLQDELAYAARSDAKVLVTGESGVGKELVARQVHDLSARRRQPFVAINCAGLPESLLETELFGHVRGSFTGAVRDRTGLLEMADGGTVFMDEIGEMTLRMQALLLRFLETGELQRVGSDRATRRLNVRVVAATNRNLLDRIAAREFREDLYYRLNVIHLIVPPLRARREDVPALLTHFSQWYARHYAVDGLEFTEGAIARLTAYDWPGNVRELKNLVERLSVRGRTGDIDEQDLPREIVARPSAPAGPMLGTRADVPNRLFDRMRFEGDAFWSVVYEPFMARDLTREDIRAVVGKGLAETHGNYKVLTELFNMAPGDYKRFLNFLRKHGCQMPYQQFRIAVRPERPERQPVGVAVA